jgi:pyridoxal biosynthesis lyase PdxS
LSYFEIFECSYLDLIWTIYLYAEADMKRELARKEQERKKSPKVEFTAGGVQAPIGASIPKIPGIVKLKLCIS